MFGQEFRGWAAPSLTRADVYDMRCRGAGGDVDAEPYVHQNVFTAVDPRTGRPSYDPERVPGTGKRAVFCPSHQGGKNWQPAAFNPITRLLYIPANENLCTSMEGRRGGAHTGKAVRGRPA